MTKQSLTATEIIDAVCAIYDAPQRRIVGYSRFRQDVIPRHIAFYLLKDAGWSLNEIGQVFSRHHTTVMAGVQRAQKRWIPEDFSRFHAILNLLAEYQAKKQEPVVVFRSVRGAL